MSETLLYELVTGMSVALCLLTLGWCALLVPRLKFSLDRFLVGLVGLLCTYHGVKMLREAGVLKGVGGPGVDTVSSVAITALYLLAVGILQFYTAEHRNLKYKLRLTEAREAPPLAPAVSVARDSHRVQEISHAVLESSPLAMYAVDPAGSVCCWNSAAERMFGWRKAEVIGRRLPVVRSSEEGGYTLSRKDGSQFQAEVWTAPVQLPGTGGTLTIVSAAHCAVGRA